MCTHGASYLLKIDIYVSQIIPLDTMTNRFWARVCIKDASIEFVDL